MPLPPTDGLIFKDTKKRFHEIIKQSGNSLAGTLAHLKCLICRLAGVSVALHPRLIHQDTFSGSQGSFHLFHK